MTHCPAIVIGGQFNPEGLGDSCAPTSLFETLGFGMRCFDFSRHARNMDPGQGTGYSTLLQATVTWGKSYDIIGVV